MCLRENAAILFSVAVATFRARSINNLANRPERRLVMVFTGSVQPCSCDAHGNCDLSSPGARDHAPVNRPSGTAQRCRFADDQTRRN
jgi:hypothetical protein